MLFVLRGILASNMKYTCNITAKILRFYTPRIFHSIAAMILYLAFHTEDIEGVGDAMNIYIYISGPLPTGGIGGHTPVPETGCHPLGRHLGLVHRHKSVVGKEKGLLCDGVGQDGLSTQGVGGDLHSVPWKRQQATCYI